MATPAGEALAVSIAPVVGHGLGIVAESVVEVYTSQQKEELKKKEEERKHSEWR